MTELYIENIRKDVEQLIRDEIEDDWFKGISQENIGYFMKWAVKCQTFKLSEIGNAFRGYSLALNINNDEKFTDLKESNIMEFNSKELQEAFNTSKNSIFSSKEEMNNISHDIRTLEGFLLENCSNKAFHYKIDDTKSLIWDIFSKQGMRLILKVNETSTNDACFKPLIECKFSTRKEIYPFLPNIFIEFSKNLKKNKG